MPFRVLLPLLAVVALLMQAPLALASAGLVGDTSCCCPDPDKCECHDHDGRAQHDAEMKRCGGGPVKVVAPILLAAVPPPARPMLLPARAIAAAVDTVVVLPEGRPERPEKPPS